MSYAKLLYDLPVERLREIVRRRAPALRGVPRIADKEALVRYLAQALSQPHSIMAAINETSLFEMQVLIYAIVEGGEVTVKDLAHAVGIDHRATVDRAVDRLEANGLVVRAVRDGRALVAVPQSVQTHAPLPLPLRYRLERGLASYDAATLSRICTGLGVPRDQATSNAARIAAIVAANTDAARLGERLKQLSPEAVSVLDYVLRAGGAADLADIALRLDTRHRNQLYAYGWSRRWAQDKPRNGLEELLGQALLVMDTPVAWGYGHLLIPGDVLDAINGRKASIDFRPAVPAWSTVAAETSAPQRHDTLTRDVACLFGFLGRTDAPRTAKGTIHRNVLKSLAKALSVQHARYASFVYALCRDAGLIEPQSRNDLYDVTAQGLEWLDLDADARQRLLADTWRSQTAYSEPLDEPLVDGPAYYGEDARAIRECVVALLKDLAREHPGQLASLDSLTARAEFLWWAKFPPARHGGPDDDAEAEPDEDDLASVGLPNRAVLGRVCAESLYWLGMTEVLRASTGEATHVRLSDAGRRWLLPEGVGAAIPSVDTFVVQPNQEVYAPPNLAPRLLYRLFRVAEPAPGGMLMLSRDILRRAFDHGETVERLLGFLRKHSQTGVPQNVEYLIKEVGDRHGHIKVGHAGIYLQVSDPVLLKEIRARKNLSVRFRRDLSDTVALITGDSVDSVVRALRQAGYYPVNADEAEQRSPSAAQRPRRTARPPIAVGTVPADAEACIDWAAVARSDGHPPSV